METLNAAARYASGVRAISRASRRRRSIAADRCRPPVAALAEARAWIEESRPASVRALVGVKGRVWGR